MVSYVLSSRVCVLCVILLPTVWAAEYCTRYVDTFGNVHDSEKCWKYCCGNCQRKFCCQDKDYRLDPNRCSGGSSNNDKAKLPTLLGSILGSVLPILLCVGLVICCVAPCCLFYKKCRKGRSQGQPHVITTHNVVPGPHNPAGAPGYQPNFPGYQPVPVQPGYGGLPNPGGSPPSYNEASGFGPGQPLYPLPGLPYGPSPNPNEHVQPPYNPNYPHFP